MTIKKYILAIALVFGFISMNAQTLRALEKAGDNAMTSNDYFAAITHYGEILSVKEDRLDIAYKYGLAAHSFNAFEIAEKSFAKIASNNIEDEELSKQLSNVKFWLGDTQKKMGKYEDAIVSFKDFLRSTSTLEETDQDLVALASKQIEDCEWAASQEKLEMDNGYVITHLGDDVNTPYAEFAPVSIEDELFFTSLRYEKDRYTRNRILSFSKVMKSNKGTINTILLDSYDSTDKHIAHTAFTKERDQVFFTVCGYDSDRNISCQLFSGALMNKDTWGQVVPLSESINIEGQTVTQPNIGYEGDQAYLYFVSDREGGKGGDDIWRAKLGADGSVATPENLKSINTEGDDITPFFHSNSNTLYFSSNGRQSMGGHDVYSVKISADGVGDVEHFGLPLNSSYNDVYFTLGADEELGHISSNRPESKYLVDSLASCCYDLYKIDFENQLNLQANLFDEDTEDPIMQSTAVIKELTHDLSANDKLDDANTYEVDVLRNRKYELTFAAPGYESKTIMVSTMDVKRNADLSEDVMLKPLPIALLATALDAKSLAALSEVTYTLYEDDNGTWKKVKELTIKDLNKFDLTLDRNKKYRITASRMDYKDTFEEFDTYDLIGGSSKEISLLLDKMTPSEIIKRGLDEFLPVPLYFDNDKPKMNLADITKTQFTYGQLNDAYYLRKAKFLNVNALGLTGEQRTMVSGDVESFFESDVRYAKESLNVFCESLVEYLELGNTAEIMIQGYASPLADPEYNLRLGQRRTSSIQNHINQWGGGALLKFVNNGSLKITFKSYGEAEVQPGVSDNPADIKNSIYALDASRERRVTIIEVK